MPTFALLSTDLFRNIEDKIALFRSIYKTDCLTYIQSDIEKIQVKQTLTGEIFKWNLVEGFEIAMVNGFKLWLVIDLCGP